MTQKEFFEELEEATHAKEKLIAEVKSYGLPVILFGAGNYARTVTDILNHYGLEIAGYAVDEEYYQPNKIFLNRPVYKFDELYKKPKEQVFFGAMQLSLHSEEIIEISIARRFNLFNDKNIIMYDFLPPGFSGERISYDFIMENKDKFWKTYSILSDDLSKETMLFYLKSHISEVVTQNEESADSEEYFNEFTAPAICSGEGVYVDCGAFTGDTIKSFVDFVNGKYKQIFALEPDKKNFDTLQKFIKEKNYKNVSFFNCGAWNEKTVLSFGLAGTMAATVADWGTDSINVNSIDNIVGDVNVNLIKMDIEGAELNALKGAEKTLKNSRPALAISAYHRKEDLITLPQFVRNIYGNCKCYLRKYHNYDLDEFDLYFIPE